MSQLMECDCHVDVDIPILLPEMDFVLSCISIVVVDTKIIEKKLGTMLLAQCLELLLKLFSCHPSYLHWADDKKDVRSLTQHRVHINIESR